MGRRVVSDREEERVGGWAVIASGSDPERVRFLLVRLSAATPLEMAEESRL